jgi:hypothetical protein
MAVFKLNLESRFTLRSLNNNLVREIVQQVDRHFCGARIWRLNAFEIETRVVLELICSEAASFSEPQLPPEVASLRHILLT